MSETFDSARVARLSQLTIPVDVTIAVLEMTGEELLKVGAGSVLSLSLSDFPEVTLHVGGEPFAKAKLLRDGERFGLEVLSLMALSQNSA